MAIRATSPIASATAGKPYSNYLGDNSAGYRWEVPPGFFLPPGLMLDTATGELRGVPTLPGTWRFYVREKNTSTGVYTQAEVNMEILNDRGTNETTVEELIAQAFAINGRFAGQESYIVKELDDNGQRRFALKVNDEGQEITLASVVIA